MSYIENPKTKGSGIICCIPQKGKCPRGCPDCFFQSGRSYLEPLNENLPNIPAPLDAKGRVVRMNDGNDSNVQRATVISAAEAFEDVFFNTSFPDRIDQYPGPVVLTVNPGTMTDNDFHQVRQLANIMFVRVRTNVWNLESVVDKVVAYYSDVPVVLTHMAYYGEGVPEEHASCYEFKKRTLNSYWVLTEEARKSIEARYMDNPMVHTCGWKGTHSCASCGNCMREYYATKERMRSRV